ncbi:MAG: MOSC domain-containing protein [Lysobacterales bacterium]
MEEAQVTGLYVYPVKSMKGIALDEATLTPKGLEHDRRWMVVRPEGRFVTQRDEPRLALIHTRLDGRGLTLSRDGHGSIFVPFEFTGGPRLQTRVWNDACSVEDEGDAIGRWLTDAIGDSQGLRLVRMAAGFQRTLAATDRYGAGTTMEFADSAPYLVASESSLERLNTELEMQGHAPVPMNRFRPNIVLRGLPPFAEHHSARLEGDGWSIALVDYCERCLVTTVDQDTAQRDPAREPYQTLRHLNPAPGEKAAPAFAQNAKLGSGAGTRITVGATATLAC